MFRKYGFFGIVLVVLVELNFIFKIQPFANWYFPIIWLGYILIIDALIYKLRKESPLTKQPKMMIAIFLFSIPFWYSFEFFNLFTLNWIYNPEFNHLIRFISAAFIFPAVYETYILISTLPLFEKAKLHESYNITKGFLFTMIGTGVLCFGLPIFFPKYAFPLIGVSFFFILDPINYLHKKPSIVGHLKDRNLHTPLSLVLVGLVVGLLWEFWNYWAIPKWFYNVPFFGFLKVFEMPVLGYLGYIPFTFELYAMYWFTLSLFRHKKHLIKGKRIN
jgi:hypothetical protein